MNFVSWENFENWYQTQTADIQALDEITTLRDAGIQHPGTPIPDFAEIEQILRQNDLAPARATLNQARRFAPASTAFSSVPAYSMTADRQAETLKESVLPGFKAGIRAVQDLFAPTEYVAGDKSFVLSPATVNLFAAMLAGMISDAGSGRSSDLQLRNLAGCCQAFGGSTSMMRDVLPLYQGLSDLQISSPSGSRSLKEFVSKNASALRAKLDFNPGQKISAVIGLPKSLTDLAESLILAFPNVQEQLAGFEEGQAFGHFHQSAQAFQDRLEGTVDHISKLSGPSAVFKILEFFPDPRAQQHLLRQIGIDPEWLSSAQKPEGATDEVWQYHQQFKKQQDSYGTRQMVMAGLSTAAMVFLGIVAAAFPAFAVVAVPALVGGGAGFAAKDLADENRRYQATAAAAALKQLPKARALAPLSDVERARARLSAAQLKTVPEVALGLAGMGASARVIQSGLGTIGRVVANTAIGAGVGAAIPAIDGRQWQDGHVGASMLVGAGFGAGGALAGEVGVMGVRALQKPHARPVASIPSRAELVENPVVLRHLKHLAKTAPLAEFEIYQNLSTGELLIVRGADDQTHMRPTITSIDESGHVVGESYDLAGASVPENARLLAQVHPSDRGFTVEPSLDDVIRFLQEPQLGEHHILRMREGGQIESARLVRDSAGRVSLDVDESTPGAAAMRERFAARLSQAEEWLQSNPHAELRAAADLTPEESANLCKFKKRKEEAKQKIDKLTELATQHKDNPKIRDEITLVRTKLSEIRKELEALRTKNEEESKGDLLEILNQDLDELLERLRSLGRDFERSLQDVGINAKLRADYLELNPAVQAKIEFENVEGINEVSQQSGNITVVLESWVSSVPSLQRFADGAKRIPQCSREFTSLKEQMLNGNPSPGIQSRGDRRWRQGIQEIRGRNGARIVVKVENIGSVRRVIILAETWEQHERDSFPTVQEEYNDYKFNMGPPKR